jgi:hypothetical protein
MKNKNFRRASAKVMNAKRTTNLWAKGKIVGWPGTGDVLPKIPIKNLNKKSSYEQDLSNYN